MHGHRTSFTREQDKPMLCNATGADKTRLFRSARIDVALVLVFQDNGRWLLLCPKSTQKKGIEPLTWSKQEPACVSFKRIACVVNQLPFA